MKRKVLGRGLDALLPSQTQAETEMNQVDIDRIRPNRYQPRQEFDKEALEELADSIRDNGVIQPLILRPDGKDYELIAGERRWRAAQLAGLQKVPAVIKSINDDRLLELALIENIQREDLGPLETARGYELLMDEYSLTQEQVAKRVGKKRSSVANYLRLLGLADRVKELVSEAVLTMGHARALAGVQESKPQVELAEKIAKEGLSVRATEKLVEALKSTPAEEETEEAPAAPPKKDPNIKAAEEALTRRLGTRVTIRERGPGGRIEIPYKKASELHRIYELLLSLEA